MNTYLLIKCVHIVSSVFLVGTGFGTAFYLFFANRSRDVAAIAVVSRLVVRADTWFTFPAVIVQPVSGFWLMSQSGWTIDLFWISAAIVLYVLAGACWLPVVWLQMRLRDLAGDACARQLALPPLYWQYARIWEGLGYPAFVAMAGIYLLMVLKPAQMF